MVGDFLYRSISFPIANGGRELADSCIRRLRFVLLCRLDSWHIPGPDVSRDFFFDAVDSVVGLSGLPDFLFCPSFQSAWENTGCMSRIRILPEAVANRIAARPVVEHPPSVVQAQLASSLAAGANTIAVAAQAVR